MGFRDFPYTNYHDLNADWLLETVKKDAESNEELKATTDAIQKKVETDLNSQNTKIDDLQKTTTARLTAQDAKIAENNSSEVQLINKWGTDLRQETTNTINTWGKNLDNHITKVGKDNTALINQWGESVPLYINTYLEDYVDQGKLTDDIIASIEKLGYMNIFTNRYIGIISPNNWNIQWVMNALNSGNENALAGEHLFTGFDDTSFDEIDGGATDIVIFTNVVFDINDISTITNYFTTMHDLFPNAVLHMVSPFIDVNNDYAYTEFYSLMMWKICQKCDVCYMDIRFNDIFSHTQGFYNSETGSYVDNKLLSELIVNKVVTYANDRPNFKPVTYNATNFIILNNFGIKITNLTIPAAKNYTVKVYNDGVAILSSSNLPFVPASDITTMSITCESIYDVNNDVLVSGYTDFNTYLAFMLVKFGNSYVFRQYTANMTYPTFINLNFKIDI